MSTYRRPEWRVVVAGLVLGAVAGLVVLCWLLGA